MDSAEIMASMRRLPVGKGYPPSHPLSAVTAFEHQLGNGKLWCVSWDNRAATLVGFPAARSEPRQEYLISAYHSVQRMLADPVGPQPLTVRS